MKKKIAAPTVGSELIGYCRRRLMEEYFPRLEQCLDTLSDEDIWWRAHETDNSIGNLLLHLRGNVHQWIVSGLGGSADDRQRSLEFSARSQVPKGQLLRQLRETLEAADRTLERFDPDLLLEVRRFQKWDVSCLDAITHVVEHFAQHLGQIIYITKLRTGKDLKFYNL